MPDRKKALAGFAALSGGSEAHAVGSMGPTFQWPVRVYWEDTDAGGIVFYANYLKFFERSRTEWLRSLGLQQQRLKDSTGGMFVVSETSVRYHRPARLDDELIVTASLVETGRASMIIKQHALLKTEQNCTASEVVIPSSGVSSALAMGTARPAAGDTRLHLLCEATIRIGWIDATSFQPCRIPASILERLKT